VKSKVVLLVLLAGLLAVVPSAAFGRTAHAASNSQTYQDSTGEDPNAPDITTIVVSNDDSGLITFKINISNRPTLTSDMDIELVLDTDQNPSTGDPSVPGGDYLIDLASGQVGLFKWNGTNYSFAQSQTSLTFGYDATGATIRVSAADLGKTKGFNFVAVAASGVTVDSSGNPDYTNAHADLAPDAGHGLFNYKVIQKLSLSVAAFTTGPKPAKAGKNFSAGLAATESDTNGPVATGAVACSATVGTAHLATVGKSVKNGIAACVWHLPANARGKTVRGTVTLTVQGVSVKRSFSAKVT
jgi:hypothetical protein